MFIVVMGSTEVEDSYQGARLEDDNITLEFVQKMMDDFKQQRSIHTRYLGAFFDAVLNVPYLVEILGNCITIFTVFESWICCFL